MKDEACSSLKTCHLLDSWVQCQTIPHLQIDNSLQRLPNSLQLIDTKHHALRLAAICGANCRLKDVRSAGVERAQ